MKTWLFVAAIMGGLAVLFSAFGEHVLAPRSVATFATGARYQLTHALAMGLAALAARGNAKALAERAAMLFFIGILLFSGSLYGLALAGTRILGIVTPLGGLALIAGWVVLALAALKLETS